jgi:DnaJ-class molecular chaperone
MKKPKREDFVTEIKCPACEGTGLAKVTQVVQPGRKIYPPPCKECSGKGRIEAPRSGRGLGPRLAPS